MRKRGRHLRIACISVPQRLQAGIGSLAGLLELATQFRGARCIVAGIFSPVVIALIPLHLEGRHVGGQVGRRLGLGGTRDGDRIALAEGRVGILAKQRIPFTGTRVQGHCTRGSPYLGAS